MSKKRVPPGNLSTPPVHVRHSELERTDSSIYRSFCPVCKGGLLLVRRDPETIELMAEDNCIGCGQAFIYDDIEEMRKIDHRLPPITRD
jgi:hypothetical protein